MPLLALRDQGIPLVSPAVKAQAEAAAAAHAQTLAEKLAMAARQVTIDTSHHHHVRLLHPFADVKHAVHSVPRACSSSSPQTGNKLAIAAFV